MLEKIGHYSLTHPASIYDEEALTALKLCARTAGKVNEAVDAFNKLEKDTEDHLAEQDKMIPELVDETMLEHIEAGVFEGFIDRFLGNLKARVDNLLGSIQTGSTTLDAEVIDSRTGIAGEAYSSLGDALRSQVETLIGAPDKNSSAWGGTKTHETIFRSLNSIYAQCKAKGIDIIFVSPIPCIVTQEDGKPRHAEDIDHIIRKLSEECHVEYVSMYNLFMNYCEGHDITIDSLLKDGLHPNDHGYLVMFNLIVTALGISPKRTGASW